jgi:hypothetical protein
MSQPISRAPGKQLKVGTTEALQVAIVDGSGNQITTFGGSGGTADADRSAHVAGTTSGTPAQGVFESVVTTVADGKVGTVGMTTNRELKVSVTSGGTSGTQYTEGDTDSSITGNAIIFEGAADTLTSVSAASPLPTVVSSALPAGANAIGKLAANSGVDIGDVDVTSLPNVTLAAGTNTNEVVGDVAHDAVAAGNPLLTGAYASAAAPTDVSGDGDAVRLWALRSGAQAVQPTFAGVLGVAGNGASGTGVQRVTLANDSTGVLATVATVTTVSTLSTLTGGGIAHDGVDSGNPIKVGLKAKSSPKGLTLVAADDRSDAFCDLDGIQMVKLGTSNADIVSEAVSNTDGASTAFTNFSAVASTKNYVTAISIYRTDAGSTPAYVDFRDGTAGSVLWRAVLPPNGGSVITSAIPLFKTSANTALAFDVSAALSTVYISVSGFQSKA